MFYALWTHPLWMLVLQADVVSKFVLALLLGMSLGCWSLFFYKIYLLRAKKRHMVTVFNYMQHIATLDDLHRVANACGQTMPGYFLTHNMQYLNSLLAMNGQQTMSKLGGAYWQQLQDNLYHTIDEIIYHEEGMLWILSTNAGAATLLGLFGTIWGLVHAFLNISQKQTADIAVVAPGIAEALLTTLAGLMVAIPALVMFNYLVMQVRWLEQQLLSLVQHFNRAIQTKFMC